MPVARAKALKTEIDMDTLFKKFIKQKEEPYRQMRLEIFQRVQILGAC